jgi:hypothetical protein
LPVLPLAAACAIVEAIEGGAELLAARSAGAQAYNDAKLVEKKP